MPAPGVIHEIEIVVSQKNFMAKGQKGPEPIEIKGHRKDTTVEEFEGLSPGKMKRTLTKSETGGEFLINGEKNAPPHSIDILFQIPMILTYSGSDWSAEFEGEPPSRSPAELTKMLATKFNEECGVALCGELPRKSGDKWEADSSVFGPALVGKSLLGAVEMEGDFAVEFVEVKEFQGTPCAVLSVSFDLAGTPSDKASKEEPGMKAKGTGKIYRSLKDRVDLVWQLKGKLEIATVADAPFKLEASSDFTVTGKTKITLK